ncbi:LysR substrate-binding domain-containing protein [Pseudomonas sp. O64]|uniref:LysR substrate-binding domain-containing protein n=1 Tax=unclassified Pseudomonas TaxID=196821 RepID=UPI00387ACC60
MAERLPPLYALRAFEIAARTSSFTRAAQELSLTQSAISRHIKTLEGILDCRLFERHGPRLELTVAGERLAQELKVGFRIIEQACAPFRAGTGDLRLKAPSTLTMRWLLHALDELKLSTPELAIQLASVWMDFDSVDFYAEPYDCAILLGNGQFGSEVQTHKLFDEWLIPICAPGWVDTELADTELVHPTPDRRDWRRWLAAQPLDARVNLDRGKVFDTLDQAISAAMRGHGVSIGDLHLVANDVRDGLIKLPYATAVASGDAYYLVWPKSSRHGPKLRELCECLTRLVPALDLPGLEFLPAGH